MKDNPENTEAFHIHCAAVLMTRDAYLNMPRSLDHIKQTVIPIVQSGGRLDDLNIKPLHVDKPEPAVSFALSALCSLGWVSRWSRGLYKMTDEGKNWLATQKSKSAAYTATLATLVDRNRLRGAEYRRSRAKSENDRLFSQMEDQCKAIEAMELASATARKAKDVIKEITAASAVMAIEIDGIKTTGTPEQCAEFARRYRTGVR